MSVQAEHKLIVPLWLGVTMNSLLLTLEILTLCELYNYHFYANEVMACDPHWSAQLICLTKHGVDGQLRRLDRSQAYACKTMQTRDAVPHHQCSRKVS